MLLENYLTTNDEYQIKIGMNLFWVKNIIIQLVKVININDLLIECENNLNEKIQFSPVSYSIYNDEKTFINCTSELFFDEINAKALKQKNKLNNLLQDIKRYNIYNDNIEFLELKLKELKQEIKIVRKHDFLYFDNIKETSLRLEKIEEDDDVVIGKVVKENGMIYIFSKKEKITYNRNNIKFKTIPYKYIRNSFKELYTLDIFPYYYNGILEEIKNLENKSNSIGLLYLIRE
jgi:hypothetical protein